MITTNLWMVWMWPISIQCRILLSEKAWNGGASYFFGYFEVSLVNSYIIYKASVQNPKPHLQFRRSIVDSLVSRHLSTAPPRRRVGRPSNNFIVTVDPERYNTTLRHFPGKRQQRECCIHNAGDGIRKRTAYYCPSNPPSAQMAALNNITHKTHASVTINSLSHIITHSYMLVPLHKLTWHRYCQSLACSAFHVDVYTNEHPVTAISSRYTCTCLQWVQK